MFTNKKHKFITALMLTEILYLSSCTTTASKDYFLCPIYPVAGENVAKELENADISSFPHTWEWIGRINKLRQELDLCAIWQSQY